MFMASSLTVGDWQPVRIGVDVEEIAKVKQASEVGGLRRLNRFFTAAEQAYISGNINRQAGRHAAKEAIAKSLGTGFRNGLAGRHIEILMNTAGAPSVVLHGPAADLARESCIVGTTVSWSRSGGFVFATALSYMSSATQIKPLWNTNLEESQ